VRLRVALLTTTVLALLPAGSAHALSCADPETVVAQADRAFIGTLISQDSMLLTFDVTEQIRGDLPDPVVVRDELAPEWAMRPATAAEIGLVVHDRGGEFTANACGLVPPELLRRARLEPAPPLRSYPPLSEEPWWHPPPPPVEPLQVLPARRLAASAGWAELRLGCNVACSGRVVVRANDGGQLGWQTDFTLPEHGGIVTVPLTSEGRRRLRRDPRLPVRITLRLQPDARAVTYGGSLILRGRH